MGDAMGGKGKVAILNAPPGIIIRDQRTNGFVDGLKKNHPQIEVVADQVADWDRKKAQDVLHTILAAHPDLGGVYGVNDSMALGAVDVAKEKGLIGKLVIFGNDGEVAALEFDRGRRADRHAISPTSISRAALPRAQRRSWRLAAFRRRRSPIRVIC